MITLIYTIYKKIQEKNNIEKNTAEQPLFVFTNLSNNKPFSNADLPDIDGKLIINHFDPSCEHCQYMASSFSKNKEKLKDVTILMITIADSASVAHFSTDYGLSSIPNIILLRDKKFQFSKIFGTNAIPCFFIYNNKKLVKKIIGETKIENLLN